MSTKVEVTRLATELETIQATLADLAVQNTPSDLDKRIEGQVQIRMLRDRRDVVHLQYANALDDWARRGFPETEFTP